MLAEISTSSRRIEVQQAEAVLAVAESNLKKVRKGSRPEEISIAAATVEQAEAALLEAENNFKRIFQSPLEMTKPVSSQRERNHDAERRLFYIGTTRAMDRLYLSGTNVGMDDFTRWENNL